MYVSTCTLYLGEQKESSSTLYQERKTLSHWTGRMMRGGGGGVEKRETGISNGIQIIVEINYIYRYCCYYYVLVILVLYIEDITWPHGDTEFLFEC